MMQEAPQSDETTDAAQGGGDAGGSATNVLIVEDDTFLVRAYEVMLTSQGFNVAVVTDGEAALEHLKSEGKPAVMLLDLMLPKLSGFEVLEQMQQDKTMADVPVIVLSNLGQPDDIERAKSLGAKDYFVKADTPLEKVVSVINQFTQNPDGGSNLGGGAAAPAPVPETQPAAAPPVPAEPTPAAPAAGDQTPPAPQAAEAPEMPQPAEDSAGAVPDNQPAETPEEPDAPPAAV